MHQLAARSRRSRNLDSVERSFQKVNVVRRSLNTEMRRKCAEPFGNGIFRFCHNAENGMQMGTRPQAPRAGRVQFKMRNQQMPLGAVCERAFFRPAESWCSHEKRAVTG